jgi:RNA polymerase sigma-70 factor (ECF subfamily)
VSTIDNAGSKQERFTELYEEYLPRVFRYVRYRVNNEQTAEDLTSLVFEKALTNFEKYSRDMASFSTWIFTIARNAVIDHYRVSAKRHNVSLEDVTVEIASSEVAPDDALIKREERERLHASISRLSREEQELISLKFGSELNNRQIARLLGLSESNVGTRLYRAVRKLRDNFQETHNG